MVNLRIAVVESPNAVDMFDGRSESEGLVSCCNLIGHQSLKLLARSRAEFKELCRYLGAADTNHASSSTMAPLVLHLSCHGNKDGLAFGADFVSWKAIAIDIAPILENDLYDGNFALALSSCGSGEHTIDGYIAEQHEEIRLMPRYIFSIKRESVHWPDALLGWSLLYHKLASVGLDNKVNVRNALACVKQGTGLSFAYHRWDEKSKKYFTYTSQDNINPT